MESTLRGILIAPSKGFFGAEDGHGLAGKHPAIAMCQGEFCALDLPLAACTSQLGDGFVHGEKAVNAGLDAGQQIGRASCRERGWKAVCVRGGAVSLKKKKK